MRKNTRLHFSAEGHLARVISGRKKITLRLYRPEAHDFKNGEMFVGDFSAANSSRNLIATADTELFPANQIPDHIAQEDGFKNGADAFEGLKRFYGEKLVPESTIAVIRFTLSYLY